MWSYNPFDNTCDSQAFESFGSPMNGHRMFIINLHSSYFLLYNQNKTQ